MYLVNRRLRMRNLYLHWRSFYKRHKKHLNFKIYFFNALAAIFLSLPIFYYKILFTKYSSGCAKQSIFNENWKYKVIILSQRYSKIYAIQIQIICL